MGSLLTSTNYYSNAIVGIPMVGADINVHDRHTSPRFAVGFGFERSDGSKFRYVQYANAVAAGALLGPSATNVCVASVNGLVVAPATAVAIAGETVKPGAKGSRYVEITLATVANNQFAGGYFCPVKDTGLGYTYRIMSNTATDNPASGNFRLELSEKLAVALDNTTDIAISPSKYGGLGANVAVTQTYSNAVGVSMSTVSADNYGWALTRGRVSCISSNTGLAGSPIIAGAGTTGSIAAYMTCVTTNVVIFNAYLGTLVEPAGGNGQNAIIDLRLE